MRAAFIISLAILCGCGRTVIEPTTRPAFVIDPSKPFTVELGRGSGLYGLDIVRINQTGNVDHERITQGAHVESTTVRLPPADLKELVDLANSKKLTSMGKAYYPKPRIADGTQWVLWIEQAPLGRAVYFDNAFPEAITSFASRLDAILAKNGAANATWTPAGQQGRDKQKALWARHER